MKCIIQIWVGGTYSYTAWSLPNRERSLYFHGMSFVPHNFILANSLKLTVREFYTFYSRKGIWYGSSYNCETWTSMSPH